MTKAIVGGCFHPSVTLEGMDRIEKNFSVFFQALQNAGKSPEEILEIKSRILRGEAYSIALSDINAHMPIATAEAVLDLTWYQFASAYQDNKEVFYRGMIRIYPLSEEQSKRFMQFFSNCKEAHAQRRPSSHFPDITKYNIGLTFKKGDLPLDMELTTVVYGMCEEHGVHSITAKAETQPVGNVVGTARHVYNYAKHLLSGGGSQVVGGVFTCRETDFDHLYKKTVIACHKIDPNFPVQKKAKTVYEKQQAILKMRELVEVQGTKKTINLNLIELVDLLDELEARISVSNISFPDIRRGNECIIPTVTTQN